MSFEGVVCKMLYYGMFQPCHAVDIAQLFMACLQTGINKGNLHQILRCLVISHFLMPLILQLNFLFELITHIYRPEPGNDSKSTARKDIYHDWFESQEEAEIRKAARHNRALCTVISHSHAPFATWRTRRFAFLSTYHFMYLSEARSKGNQYIKAWHLIGGVVTAVKEVENG